MPITKNDADELRKLEESLWRTVSRFDQSYMDRVLSPDYFEFGRSGRIYTREEVINLPPQEIKARLPLRDFRVHPLTDDVALVTYISEVVSGELLVGNRSSLWVRTPSGWQIVFHQGTPVTV
ncbi:MAG TPA: DUF4440 domain-containing protein [Candidatus Kryptobacter bacterium]|nr:DUF4440 domain-containing protein [Candidatus Kryptobacter bacterium]